MLIYLSLLDSEEEISKFELIYSTYKNKCIILQIIF